MNVLKLTSLTLLAFLAVGSIAVNANSKTSATLPVIELENLFAEESILLQPKEENLLFVTFFEDKCRWCLRQMSAYQKIQNKINADFVMVGVGDSKYKLRHWAKRAGTNIPTAYASDELLSLVGTPKVTPYTLIFDSEGYFLTKITGYIKPEVLSRLNSL